MKEISKYLLFFHCNCFEEMYDFCYPMICWWSCVCAYWLLQSSLTGESSSPEWLTGLADLSVDWVHRRLLPFRRLLGSSALRSSTFRQSIPIWLDALGSRLVVSGGQNPLTLWCSCTRMRSLEGFALHSEIVKFFENVERNRSYICYWQ